MPTERDAELAALVRAHYGDVWSLCGALVDRQLADDLAQETFIRAARALDTFRGESSVRTWLLSIARRTCADELRGRSRRAQRDACLERETSGHPDGPGPSHAVEVRDLLAQLDPERRTAFALTQLLGLSYAEAAEACECPVGTIRSRVARAREDLIEQLGEGGAVREPGPAPRRQVR